MIKLIEDNTNHLSEVSIKRSDVRLLEVIDLPLVVPELEWYLAVDVYNWIPSQVLAIDKVVWMEEVGAVLSGDLDRTTSCKVFQLINQQRIKQLI